MRLAQGLLADKDYRGALAQFDLAVQQDPGNVIALNNLAWACQQQRDPRAAAFAERAYRLAPHNAAVLDTLAWILKDQGQTARALTLAQQANAAAPASLDIRYHYAVLLADAGRRQEARTQFEQLLAHKDFGRRPEVQAMLARW
jgi:tetratricopeptide (TPR) repeat protein